MTKDIDGLLGCIARSKCRSTGTTTAIYDASLQGIDVGEDKYAVICEDHGSILACETLTMARTFKPHPLEFCDGCRERNTP